jgi:uncharacterized protein YjiS (DUF1127 family)
VILLNPEADGAVAAYEELRRHRLAGSPGGPHFGMVVLLREGIAAWIERRATCRGLAEQSATHSAPRPVLSGALHTQIVHVLADIALEGRGELKP